jgi:hypothetical protein
MTDYTLPPPGKFEGTGTDYLLAEALYGETPDDEIGTVEDIGWHGLFADEGAILIEDSQGFVSILTFETPEAVDLTWSAVGHEYSAFMADVEAERYAITYGGILIDPEDVPIE